MQISKEKKILHVVLAEILPVGALEELDTERRHGVASSAIMIGSRVSLRISSNLRHRDIENLNMSHRHTRCAHHILQMKRRKERKKRKASALI